MKNGHKIILITFILSLLLGFNSYAQLNGVNNNRSEWSKRINAALDTIGAKIVDSVVEDESERKKYEGLEQWEIDKMKALEASRSEICVSTSSEIYKATDSEVKP